MMRLLSWLAGGSYNPKLWYGTNLKYARAAFKQALNVRTKLVAKQIPCSLLTVSGQFRPGSLKSEDGCSEGTQRQDAVASGML